MEAQTGKLPKGCIKESFKENLRIRLYQFRKDDEAVSHMVEVVAWNAWAGQGKIISAVGGIDRDSARELFKKLTTDLSHYDWMQGEIVMEGETPSDK